MGTSTQVELDEDVQGAGHVFAALELRGAGVSERHSQSHVGVQKNTLLEKLFALGGKRIFAA